MEFSCSALQLRTKQMREALYSPINRRLCELMKNARTEVGITQSELAMKTGRTQAYISKFESNQLRLDVADFIAFCAVLKLDPKFAIGELYSLIDEQSPN